MHSADHSPHAVADHAVRINFAIALTTSHFCDVSGFLDFCYTVIGSVKNITVIIDLFVESLVENKEPEISGENVLHAMKAVFASIESSATGRAVEVK